MKISRVVLPLLWLLLISLSAHGQSDVTFPNQANLDNDLTAIRWQNSWRQLAELRSSNGESGEEFGVSVAISGNTAVVGTDDYGLSQAYVFVKPSTGWQNMVQAAVLTPSDNAQGFGWNVAINGDTIAVAGEGNYPYGTIYVYVKPATGWHDMSETARLTTTVDYGYLIGATLAVSGDVVGTSAYRSGSGLVYQKPKDGWHNSDTPNALLNVTPSYYEIESLAIGGDTVIAGAGYDYQGTEASVFLKPQGRWTGNINPTAQLIPSDPSYDFGYSAAIDQSGDTVVVAARKNCYCYSDNLFLFLRPSQGWVNMTPTAKLDVPKNFGFENVAIDENGTNIVAGSPGATVGAHQSQGAVYIFSKPSTGWKSTDQFRKIIASDGHSQNEFGYSVSISHSTIVAGAPYRKVGSNLWQGITYVFGN